MRFEDKVAIKHDKQFERVKQLHSHNTQPKTGWIEF